MLDLFHSSAAKFLPKFDKFYIFANFSCPFFAKLCLVLISKNLLVKISNPSFIFYQVCNLWSIYPLPHFKHFTVLYLSIVRQSWVVCLLVCLNGNVQILPVPAVSTWTDTKTLIIPWSWRQSWYSWHRCWHLSLWCISSSG